MPVRAVGMLALAAGVLVRAVGALARAGGVLALGVALLGRAAALLAGIRVTRAEPGPMVPSMGAPAPVVRNATVAPADAVGSTAGVTRRDARAAQCGAGKRAGGLTSRNVPGAQPGRAGQAAARAPRVATAPAGYADHSRSPGGHPVPAGNGPGQRAGVRPGGPAGSAKPIGPGQPIEPGAQAGPRGTVPPDRTYRTPSPQTNWIRRSGPSCARCPVILPTRWHAAWWPPTWPGIPSRPISSRWPHGAWRPGWESCAKPAVSPLTARAGGQRRSPNCGPRAG